MHEECVPVASTLNLQWPLILWSPSRLVDPKGAKGIELTNGHLVTFAGGIPLKDVDGQIIGSIGVSWGLVTQEYAVAQSGQSALKA
jgi:uncharacterized protein GlcG (DUF336 family)